MKAFIGGLVALFILSSCQPMMKGMEYPVIETPLNQAWTASASLSYISDGDNPYWQSPKETEKKGGGDCEDIATYLVYYLGPQSSLIVIESCGIKHAIVKYGDRFIEPDTVNCFYSLTKKGLEVSGQVWQIKRIIDYDTTIYLSTDNFTK